MCCAIESLCFIVACPDAATHSNETRVPRSVAAKDSTFQWRRLCVAVQMRQDILNDFGHFNVVRNFSTSDIILFPTS